MRILNCNLRFLNKVGGHHTPINVKTLAADSIGLSHLSPHRKSTD